MSETKPEPFTPAELDRYRAEASDFAVSDMTRWLATIAAAEARIAKLHGIALGRCNAELEARIAELEDAFKDRVCGCGTPRRSCNIGLRHEIRDAKGAMRCMTCPDAPLATALPSEPSHYYCTAELLDHLVHAEFEADCSTNLDIPRFEARIAEQDRQITDLQAANTREVLRRREAEEARREITAQIATLATAAEAYMEHVRCCVIHAFPGLRPQANCEVRAALAQALAKLEPEPKPTRSRMTGGPQNAVGEWPDDFSRGNGNW